MHSNGRHLTSRSLAAAVALTFAPGVACAQSPALQEIGTVLYQVGSAMADLDSLETQLKLYKALNGFFPSTEQGLKALAVRPADPPIPQHWRKLMDQVPVDPWGHPYIYRCPGIRNPNSFDIYSAGPDGKPATADDLWNW